jgi:hypothetical protein
MLKIPKFHLFGLDFVAKNIYILKLWFTFKLDYVFLAMVAIFCMDDYHCGYEPKIFKKIPWVDSTYLDIIIGNFENFGSGRSNFFSPKTKYILCNLLQMGVRYDMQVGNTQIKHKDHVQNHMGKCYQPHLIMGRFDSWFQRFVFSQKKPFIIVPKNL